MEVSGVTGFRRCISIKVLYNNIRIIRGEPDILSVSFRDRNLVLEQRIRRSIRSFYMFLKLQPAAAVVPRLQNVFSAKRHILMAFDRVVINAIGTGCIIILDQHGRCAIDHHRVINFTGQFPTIRPRVIFRLNDLIIMAGLDHFIAIICLCDLTKRDIEIIDFPVVCTGHRDSIIPIQIILTVPGHDQLDRHSRRILLVKHVIPDLLHTDCLGRQRHSLRNNILFNHIIHVSGRISERSIQMGICQQVIGTVGILADAGCSKLRIRHGDNAIVQVRNGIVGFLAGPHGKLNGVDPSFLQCACFTKVPGHAVRFIIGCTGSALVIFTRGACNPFFLGAARRFDIIFEAARFAGSNIRAHVRERRDTVVHSDVRSSHTGNDRTSDLAERRFNRSCG